MTTEDLDRSDTRRPWTRPTLRRLAGGGQARAATFALDPTERIVTVGGPSFTYNVGPASP